MMGGSVKRILEFSFGFYATYGIWFSIEKIEKMQILGIFKKHDLIERKNTVCHAPL
jgi:hypothetical protein